MNPNIEHDDEFIESEEHAGQDEMDALMDSYLDKMSGAKRAGQSVRVTIVAMRDQRAMVDVGDKAEGAIDLRELSDEAGNLLYKIGDEVDAIIKEEDEETGLLILSHSEARRRAAQEAIATAVKEDRPVQGRVVRVVKGGLIVDLGATAFLPASQIDRKRIENFEEWVGRDVECFVIEYAPENKRIILSRRKFVDQQEKERRDELFKQYSIGQTLEGTVKRIQDFGAFVDLGGLDGLVPRGEVSWHRMARPEEYLKPGEKVTVKIIDMDVNTGRITISRRRLCPDPWESAAQKYPAGATVEGDVVSLTSYGAFVRLEEGLDGMIHIGDMAWDSGGRQPSDYLTAGQRVQARVISVDTGARRMSLGLKQLTTDPWSELESRYPIHSTIKGRVTGLAKYGAFVELEPGIEGLIHISDFSWDQRITNPRDMVNKGDEVEACVLKIDLNQRRISLGIKQLTTAPIILFSQQHRTGSAVEGEVTALSESGATLKLAEGVEGFIHVSQLDAGRVESPAKDFKIGQILQAEITRIDTQSGKVQLNRRSLLKKEEKQTLAKYLNRKSSTSGGTNLGELLSELPLDDDILKG